MSSLREMMDAPVDQYTLTPGYRSHIESLKQILRFDPNTQAVAIPPETGYQFRGNLTGLLLQLKLPRNYHFVVMRTNGIDSIHDIDETRTVLYIPSIQVMDQMMKLYQQSLTKK